MEQHFNIGKKTAVNPFENVKGFTVSRQTDTYDRLSCLLCKHEPRVVKIGCNWELVWPLEILDFTVLISWYSTTRGKFTKGNGKSVHFQIDEEIMRCW